MNDLHNGLTFFSNSEQMLMTWDKHEKVVAINDTCYLDEISHTNS